MTLENDKVISANRGERTYRIIVDSHLGWTTVFEKWEDGAVTRRFRAPEHIKYKSISRVIIEGEDMNLIGGKVLLLIEQRSNQKSPTI